MADFEPTSRVRGTGEISEAYKPPPELPPKFTLTLDHSPSGRFSRSFVEPTRRFKEILLKGGSGVPELGERLKGPTVSESGSVLKEGGDLPLYSGAYFDLNGETSDLKPLKDFHKFLRALHDSAEDVDLKKVRFKVAHEVADTRRFHSGTRTKKTTMTAADLLAALDAKVFSATAAAATSPLGYDGASTLESISARRRRPTTTVHPPPTVLETSASDSSGPGAATDLFRAISGEIGADEFKSPVTITARATDQHLRELLGLPTVRTGGIADRLRAGIRAALAEDPETKLDLENDLEGAKGFYQKLLGAAGDTGKLEGTLQFGDGRSASIRQLLKGLEGALVAKGVNISALHDGYISGLVPSDEPGLNTLLPDRASRENPASKLKAIWQKAMEVEARREAGRGPLTKMRDGFFNMIGEGARNFFANTFGWGRGRDILAARIDKIVSSLAEGKHPDDAAEQATWKLAQLRSIGILPPPAATTGT